MGGGKVRKECEEKNTSKICHNSSDWEDANREMWKALGGMNQKPLSFSNYMSGRSGGRLPVAEYLDAFNGLFRSKELKRELQSKWKFQPKVATLGKRKGLAVGGRVAKTTVSWFCFLGSSGGLRTCCFVRRALPIKVSSGVRCT